MFNLGGDEVKKENNVQCIYFNTKNTFLIKDLPLKEDGTVTIGNKTWEVSHTTPYLEVEDSFFKKKSVRPTYILTTNSAVPHRLKVGNDNENKLDNPLFLDELIKFKALKKMMDFRITKEGGISSGSPAMLKYILFAAAIIGGWIFIRYFWLGTGQ